MRCIRGNSPERALVELPKQHAGDAAEPDVRVVLLRDDFPTSCTATASQHAPHAVQVPLMVRFTE